MEEHIIAKSIYSAIEDMDMMDYSDSKEEEINLLTEAISKVKAYARYNDDFNALYNALEQIFGE